MADKNFARSGTGDAGLLADDDPLSELAHLVNFDPRPMQGVTGSLPEVAQPTPRSGNPVLALEDELMRAFEQYDAPAGFSAQEPPIAESLSSRHVEPVFDVPLPVAEDRAAILDEVPTRDVFASEPRHQEPAFVEPVFEAPSFETYDTPTYAEPVSEQVVADDRVDPVETLPSHDAYPIESRDAEPYFGEPQASDISVDQDDVAADAPLMLADELENAVHDVPAVSVEPEVHSGLQFAERFEPQFETPSSHQPAAEVQSFTPTHDSEPAFLGLQPVTEDAGSELGLDLERELELSLGDSFPEEAGFLDPDSVTVMPAETHVEPAGGNWGQAAADVLPAEPFQAATAYSSEEPQFVAETSVETREERARAAAEAEQQWQTQPVLEPQLDYQVRSVHKAQGDDRDTLLAEVERFPVPPAGQPLAGAAAAAAAVAVSSAGNQQAPFANFSAIFGRATPTTNRETAAARAHEPLSRPVSEPATVQTAAVETRRDTVAVPTPQAREPELDFESMEFDLSDIDLDLSDFALEDEPVSMQPVAKAEPARPLDVERDLRREPAVAVPVSTFTRPQPVATHAADGSLPFDPTLIADTDSGVTPVAELDVPQLPAIEKEKPQAYQPDYDFDIDAEMAQLLTEPVTPSRADELVGSVSAGALAAGQPTPQINDVDDFERALEEDFRRSLRQPERMAIPVDPGQATPLYAGDGYDDETTPSNRGKLIAASIAALLLIGGGGVYAWSSFTGGATHSGEPRVILADKDPIKVVPEERGGKTVPNQDKAVYDRVAGDGTSTTQQEQLVTSTEEPVDVVQRTLTPETLPFDGADDGQEVAGADDDNRLLPGVDEPETAKADAGKPVVSPRKVRTMIVKPDGTLVAREETPAIETTATTGRSTRDAAATADPDASLRAEQAQDTQPRSALAEVASAQVDDTAPVRTVRTTTFGNEGTATTGGNTPLPESRPADQPVNVVGTVTENGNVRGTQTAAATSQTAETGQVAAVTPGSYLVQVASLPSQAEAEKTYHALSSRFGSVIGGRGVDIKQVQIPNKGTFYRVRIPAGSREEANALCSRYKNAGGSCLVTR